MGQVVYLGLCLLGCLILNTLAEGATNHTLNTRSRCPNGALVYKHYCYQFVQNAIRWDEAELTCQEMRHGSQLASILSKKEENMIGYFLKKYDVSDVWIGLESTNDATIRTWAWSDGSVFSSLLWNSRISNANTSEECVSLSNLKNPESKTWMRRSCSACFPFLCKYKAAY